MRLEHVSEFKYLGCVLELECAKAFHVSLLVLVLIYGSETVIWREKGRSRV